MNRQPFEYVVLKYRPSYLLDEQVNIGLLVTFPEERRVEFLYPKLLKRLTHLFPEAELSFIRRYLTDFKAQARRLSTGLQFSPNEKANWLAEYFLPPDATALFFSEWKRGTCRSAEELLQHLYRTYFSLYEEHADTGKHDEEFLKTQINRWLKQDASKYQLIKQDVVLSNSTSRVEFDFAWNNGSVNLVRTLGFDLKSREVILNKSYQWFGRLTALRHDVTAKQAEIHSILSPPRESDLYKAFETAQHILNEIDLPKKIYLEKDIEAYAHKALQLVHPLPPDFC